MVNAKVVLVSRIAAGLDTDRYVLSLAIIELFASMAAGTQTNRQRTFSLPSLKNRYQRVNTPI